MFQLHDILVFVTLFFQRQHTLVKASVDIDFISLYESKDGSASIINGSIHVNPFTEFKVNLIGSDLNTTRISFSRKGKSKGVSCANDRETDVHTIYSKNDDIAVVTLTFKEPNGGVFYICTSETEKGKWKHQGNSKFLSITVLKAGFELPRWLKFILVAVLMMLSGLFSGLNLGLMSLDPNELRIVLKSGTTRQKKYAKKILPARNHGNFLLCTLLLGNTLVNASFTILLDTLAGDGIVAVVGSTLLIVIFGEIVPQSICSRYGLAVGAYTIYLTKLFMLVTFPLSYPVSKILDCILGKELGTIYNKQQLLEMVRLQSDYNDLEEGEVGIISGALEYGRKLVEEVMTPIEDCFLLDEEAILDFQTISSIIKTGHSRIPVYSGERSNIVALLFVKDLAFVDPDDCIPLLSVIKFYNHPVHKVFFDTTLDKMLEEFKQGTTHLSIVLKIQEEGDGDPLYECIGIITLEDVLEEIIQAEIVDETDVFIDNASGKKVHRKHHHHHLNQDFSLFLPAPEDVQPKISPQLAFAIYQYISTAVDAFSSDLMTRAVLKKIIEYPGVIEEKEPGKDSEAVYLYKNGFPYDYFSLVIQGRVEVTVGVENIVFEDGPFSVFGINALLAESGHTFLPDYSVKVITKIQYLKVSRSLYRSALRASKMELENKTPDTYQEYDEIFWSHMNKSMITVRNSMASSKGELRSRGCSERSNDTTQQLLTHIVANNLLNKFSNDQTGNSVTPVNTPDFEVPNPFVNEKVESVPLKSEPDDGKDNEQVVSTDSKFCNSDPKTPLLGEENEEKEKLPVETSDNHVLNSEQNLVLQEKKSEGLLADAPDSNDVLNADPNEPLLGDAK